MYPKSQLERTAFGVRNRMSLSVEEARQRINNEDAVLRGLLGSEFI